MTDSLRVTALSAAKRALLEKMQARGADRPQAAIPRAPDGPVPLSFEQRRIWLLHRLAPESPVYTIPVGYRLRGPLDAGALHSALRALVARHDALRMAITEHDGEPVQSPSPEPAFGWEAADLAEMADSERETEVKRRLGDFFARAFDLERGPLLRALLLRLRGDEHRLAIALHHIVGDGWSTGILRRELGVLYAAALAGREAALPPLAAGYRDYVAWQRSTLDGLTLAADETWWRAELEGAQQVFEIPPDRPRAALQGYAGFKAPLALSPELTAAVRALARSEGTTTFVVATAAWVATLHRHALQDELILGTAEANRRQAETEGMIGFFANTLPLRFRLGDAPTARALIARTHHVVMGAREHGRIPFDRLVEMAGAKRDLSRPALVQWLIAYSDAAAGGLSLPGLAATFEVLDTGAAAFDSTLMLEDMGAVLHAELQLAADPYERATGERLVRRWRAMLAGFVAHPDARVADLPLEPEAEVLRWMEPGPADGPPPAPATLHYLFERQARIRPDAVAVACGAETVHYAVLNARANRIAHHLRGLGVALESRVGVCMRRTPEMIAALLGVLKSGAAYVPLDHAYPPARLEAILRAAGASIVLTDGPSRAAVPSGCKVIYLDAADLSYASSADPEGGAGPGNLAYVITTSGSTGGPKGVMVEHRNGHSVIDWARGALSEEERSCVLAASSTSFDASIVEIFGTLSWGGTIALAENALGELPAAAAPRTAPMVPSVAAELLRENRLPPTLGTLLIGGEAWSPALARALHATGTVTRLLNVYGPTEDSTYATFAPVPRDVERLTIGKPIARRRAYVLDARLRPVPAGVPGEIWLAGPGVTRGYAGQPGLTASRYLPDPWGTPGARMYRTLDLARRLDDGSLEYLGRGDAQLKVRGVRMEPREVEAALALHPAVAEAAVDARDDGAGGRRLVAWLVADGGERPNAAALRTFLRERLPEPMVPSAFAWVAAFPRTAGEKVDRRALPDPADGPERAEPVAPRTELEARLAEIWADVLGVDRVGVEDDFFDLGGQSIVATRLAARIRAELGHELPLALLLRASTVARLAETLAAGRAEVKPPLIPLNPHGVTRPLFLGPPGGGHVVCYHKLSALLAPSIPVFGLQARGIDDGHAPMRTVEDIADWFVAAVRRAQPRGPYHVGGWSFGGLVAWEMARQLAEIGDEVGLVALLDTGVPTDRKDDLTDHARVMHRIIADLAGWVAASNVKVEAIRHLPPREQALEAVRQVRLKSLPASRVDEILALTAVRQANLGALIAYDPPPCEIELTYFRTAASERTLPRDGAVEFWEARARGGLVLHRVAGSHGTILQPPYVSDVADKLAAAVREPSRALAGAGTDG
jgi:amino acid adenylation domain-containing protein